jgi:hypothetical protein
VTLVQAVTKVTAIGLEMLGALALPALPAPNRWHLLALDSVEARRRVGELAKCSVQPALKGHSATLRNGSVLLAPNIQSRALFIVGRRLVAGAYIVIVAAVGLAVRWRSFRPQQMLVLAKLVCSRSDFTKVLTHWLGESTRPVLDRRHTNYCRAITNQQPLAEMSVKGGVGSQDHLGNPVAA